MYYKTLLEEVSLLIGRDFKIDANSFHERCLLFLSKFQPFMTYINDEILVNTTICLFFILIKSSLIELFYEAVIEMTSNN